MVAISHWLSIGALLLTAMGWALVPLQASEENVALSLATQATESMAAELLPKAPQSEIQLIFHNLIEDRPTIRMVSDPGVEFESISVNVSESKDGWQVQRVFGARGHQEGRLQFGSVDVSGLQRLADGVSAAGYQWIWRGAVAAMKLAGVTMAIQ